MKLPELSSSFPLSLVSLAAMTTLTAIAMIVMMLVLMLSFITIPAPLLLAWGWCHLLTTTGTHCRTRCTAQRATNDGTILPTQLRTDCCAHSTA
jgi:hypothetical protein